MKKFIVKSGHHRHKGLPLYNFLSGNKIYFDFVVDESWLQKAEPSGVNKICGISTFNIHKNSARIGWQYEDNKLWAYAYYYTNGVRSYSKLCELKIGETYTCHIVAGNGEYYFRINMIRRVFKGAYGNFYFMAFPYIGGKGTFKEDWSCLLNYE